ncbi:invasion associated locus B family protein [Devosia sp.]|uniref:invasion associated locus B family protein n=1 Tax=Devosia sp. TaxID=1871048 RepID=UPI003A8F5991
MILRSCAALSVLLVSMAGPALGQSVRLLGEYRDWSAYAATEATGKVCFALAKARSVDPIPDGYTEAYLYLTHRPSESVRNEFNVVAGFNFAADTPATANVGGRSYELFTQRDAAWLLDPAQNDNLAGALRAGSSVTIEGTSEKGIKISETFSLSGATAASRAIEGDC